MSVPFILLASCFTVAWVPFIFEVTHCLSVRILPCHVFVQLCQSWYILILKLISFFGMYCSNDPSCLWLHWPYKLPIGQRGCKILDYATL